MLCEELRYAVRSVALFGDGRRWLLVTIIDEGWCVSANGAVLSGIRMPVREGCGVEILNSRPR